MAPSRSHSSPPREEGEQDGTANSPVVAGTLLGPGNTGVGAEPENQLAGGLRRRKPSTTTPPQDQENGGPTEYIIHSDNEDARRSGGEGVGAATLTEAPHCHSEHSEHNSEEYHEDESFDLCARLSSLLCCMPMPATGSGSSSGAQQQQQGSSSSSSSSAQSHQHEHSSSSNTTKTMLLKQLKSVSTSCASSCASAGKSAFSSLKKAGSNLSRWWATTDLVDCIFGGGVVSSFHSSRTGTQRRTPPPPPPPHAGGGAANRESTSPTVSSLTESQLEAMRSETDPVGYYQLRKIATAAVHQERMMEDDQTYYSSSDGGCRPRSVGGADSVGSCSSSAGVAPSGVRDSGRLRRLMRASSGSIKNLKESNPLTREGAPDSAEEDISPTTASAGRGGGSSGGEDDERFYSGASANGFSSDENDARIIVVTEDEDANHDDASLRGH